MTDSTLPDLIGFLSQHNEVSPDSRIVAAIRALQGGMAEAVAACVPAPKRRGRPPKDRSTLEGFISPFRLSDFSPLVQADLIWAFAEIQAGRKDRGEPLIKGACKAKRIQRADSLTRPPTVEVRPGVWIWAGSENYSALC